MAPEPRMGRKRIAWWREPQAIGATSVHLHSADPPDGRSLAARRAARERPSEDSRRATLRILGLTPPGFTLSPRSGLGSTQSPSNDRDANRPLKVRSARAARFTQWK